MALIMLDKDRVAATAVVGVVSLDGIALGVVLLLAGIALLRGAAPAGPRARLAGFWCIAHHVVAAGMSLAMFWPVRSFDAIGPVLAVVVASLAGIGVGALLIAAAREAPATGP